MVKKPLKTVVKTLFDGVCREFVSTMLPNVWALQCAGLRGAFGGLVRYFFSFGTVREKTNGSTILWEYLIHARFPLLKPASPSAECAAASPGVACRQTGLCFYPSPGSTFIYHILGARVLRTRGELNMGVPAALGIMPPGNSLYYIT